jgi:hypothetical protein
MKVHSPYRCDYCLNLKGETNHWWLRPPDRQRFALLRWDATLADVEGYEHICSESCAAKALSKWMAQPSAHVPTSRGVSKRIPLSTHAAEVEASSNGIL